VASRRVAPDDPGAVGGSGRLIPVLLGAEIWRLYRRPGAAHFAGVWWSAVFPLGMYSTATQATAQALRLSALTDVSLVVFWVGFSLWVLVAAGLCTQQIRQPRTQCIEGDVASAGRSVIAVAPETARQQD